MSRIFDATCEAGVVKIEGKPVTATVLSDGVKSSEGVALMEADKIQYITSNADDINDLIAQLSSLVQLIGDTFTLIGTGMTGSSTAPPPTLPAKVTSITAIKTQLDAMKDNLK